MRAAIFLVLLACAVASSLAAETGKNVPAPVNIPAQDLGSALRTLARQRNFQIVYASQEAAGRRTAGAQGTFTNLEALQKLLDGTGMTYQQLDANTVTVTVTAVPSEAVQEERAARRVSEAALPEVAVSAERDKLEAMRRKMAKLEEEFFAEYNRLNNDDQFDISCHQQVAGDGRMTPRVCKPRFVDELEGLAGSDATPCAGVSCQTTLLVPPMAAILAKSKAYEKNVLSVINEHPHLSRIVREREALEASYEALRAPDSRHVKQRRSKGTADACAQEPDSTFVRMTVAMTGYALCTGLYVEREGGAGASATEPMPEVEINARRESLRHLRAEIVRLEDEFYSKYNQLNADKQYDIQCSREAPTGSILKRRNCLPVFVNRATEDEAQALLRGYPAAPVSGVILRKWPEFEKTLVTAIQAHPELQKLSAEHAAMQKHYAMVRKLKFKGRLFVLD